VNVKEWFAHSEFCPVGGDKRAVTVTGKAAVDHSPGHGPQARPTPSRGHLFG